MSVEVESEGELCLVSCIGVIKKAEADEIMAGVARWLDEHPGGPARFLCDMQRLKVIAPDAREALLELMKRSTDRLDKAAFVAPEGTAHLQLARMIRDAGSDKRRLFTSMMEARRWLLEP